MRQWQQRPRGQRRSSLLRLPQGTALSTRSGHRLLLAGLLPQQEGAVCELGVLLGRQARVPVRLLLQKGPEEVAEQRREGLRAEAHDHGREPSAEALSLAGWLLVVSHGPGRLLTLAETLVVLRVRWQIELLFKLCQQEGQVDAWRSPKPWRIVCALYAKLAALVIQPWQIEVGCWHEPQRSLVKAAQVVRREAGQWLVALREGRVEHVVPQILGGMGSGCRIDKRR